MHSPQPRYRDRRGLPMLESLVRDLRHGARTLGKTPGFAIAGVLILGLGIGVNSAMFTVVNAVVLRPLPFADADRIMRIWHTPPSTLFAGSPIFALSPANFIDWEAQNQSFERMAIYRVGRQVLTGSGEPEAVITLRASAEFLPVLGVSPKVGRGFTRDDDRTGGARVALLSDAFFRSRFGGDPSTIGRAIVLNRVPHTVIGVVPDAPVLIDRVQVYVPLAWTGEERATRNNHNYRGIAKLRPGIDVARAQADMTAISKRLEAQYPDDNKLEASEADSETAVYAPAAQFASSGSTLTVRTIQDPRSLTRAVVNAVQAVDPEQPVLDIATLDEVVEESLGQRPLAMVLLAGFAALALVLASVGIYSVLAYTVRQRVREIGIRLALGAPVHGVLRLVLIEGLKPTLIGVALGLVLAAILVRVMTTLLYGVSQHDPGTFSTVAAIMLGIGIVATLVPAYRATRVHPVATLRAE